MAYSPPPAFQFTHLLQRVYDKLEQTKGLTATSGSSTTLIEDTTLSNEYDDTQFVGHTAFVRRDAGGAGAAPEGEYRRVASYDATNQQLTVSTAFSAALATGDQVLVARGSQFPLYDVERICNNALKDLGDVQTINTSLTTADNQTEYDMPSGVRWTDIIKVEMEGDKNDANDSQFYEIPWRVTPPSTAGGTALLVIDQYTSGYTIRITHVGPHVDLSGYADDISKDIHPILAVAACALACARWKRAATEQTILPRLEVDFAYAIQRFPIRHKPSSRYARYSASVAEDEFTYPSTE